MIRPCAADPTSLLSIACCQDVARSNYVESIEASLREPGSLARQPGVNRVLHDVRAASVRSSKIYCRFITRVLKLGLLCAEQRLPGFEVRAYIGRESSAALLTDACTTTNGIQAVLPGYEDDAAPGLQQRYVHVYKSGVS